MTATATRFAARCESRAKGRYAWARGRCTRLFESLVYGIDVRDPLSFFVAPVVLTVAAFAAIAIPATRAIGVNPTEVLRDS